MEGSARSSPFCCPSNDVQMIFEELHSRVHAGRNTQGPVKKGRIQYRCQSVDPAVGLGYPRTDLIAAGVPQHMMGIAPPSETMVEVHNSPSPVDDAAPDRGAGLRSCNGWRTVFSGRMADLHECPHRFTALRSYESPHLVDCPAIVRHPAAFGLGELARLSAASFRLPKRNRCSGP